MKTNSKLQVVVSATLLMATLAAHATPTTPSRVPSYLLGTFPYSTSGIVQNNSFRGSGTVAAGPRVVVSCAHVTYDWGWLQNNVWTARHSAATRPTSTTPLRGYWYWTDYNGGTSNRSFDNDFVVYYAYTNLANGGHSGWHWSDSNTTHPLNSSARKQIVGYPGSDGWYMNYTGPFTSAYRAQFGHYMWNSSVKGGGGMSGGGVFVEGSGQWRLAGVHVSGYANGSLGAGVRALNNNAYQLITKAITSSGGPNQPATVTKTFASTSVVAIPDNSTVWTTRSLVASGMPATLTSGNISLNISHTYRGDLEVMLTAPNGRTLTLHNRSGGSADNVVLTNHDISSSFSGINPNGTWKLSVRDVVRLDVGKLNSVSLNLTAR